MTRSPPFALAFTSLALTIQSGSSFVPTPSHQSFLPSRPHPLEPKIRRTSHKIPLMAGTLDGAVTAFDDFFRTQPFLSAFVACSVKASAADFLAQTSPAAAVEKPVIPEEETAPVEDLNYQRNLAFLLYGGLYQGMFLQFLYSVVYPFLYGGSAFQVPLTVLTDIEKYKNHVVTQNLLYKFWMVWAPAQTINFGVVPPHLRVFFVAFVSFFWVYILSGISSQETTKTGPTVT